MASTSRPTYAIMALEAVQKQSSFGKPVSRQKIKGYINKAYTPQAQPAALRAAIRRCVEKGELAAGDRKAGSFKLTARGKVVLAANAKQGGTSKAKDKQQGKKSSCKGRSKGKKKAKKAPAEVQEDTAESDGENMESEEGDEFEHERDLMGAFLEGYRTGKAEGHDDGLEHGFNGGYDEGYAQGYLEGEESQKGADKENVPPLLPASCD